MRLAVASRDGKNVSGHIGKCPRWIIFEIRISDAKEEALVVIEKEHITLPKELIFHHYKDDRPHPLKECVAVIGKSAGESFKVKMKARGIDAVLTAEENPVQAAEDYARNNVTPPKPRPIGEFICKIHDALSRHD